MAFWRPSTGPSAHFIRIMLTHVRALSLHHLDADMPASSDRQVVAAAFGAHVDLWDVILSHKEVFTALVLLVMRLIQWWNAPCLVLTAAKVSPRAQEWQSTPADTLLVQNASLWLDGPLQRLFRRAVPAKV